jgi:hypothetical protein
MLVQCCKCHRRYVGEVCPDCAHGHCDECRHPPKQFGQPRRLSWVADEEHELLRRWLKVSNAIVSANAGDPETLVELADVTDEVKQMFELGE